MGLDVGAAIRETAMAAARLAMQEIAEGETPEIPHEEREYDPMHFVILSRVIEDAMSELAMKILIGGQSA